MGWTQRQLYEDNTAEFIEALGRAAYDRAKAQNQK